MARVSNTRNSKDIDSFKFQSKFQITTTYMLKYFKLLVSYPVRSKIRDELIKTEILIQEAKYMDNLKKF